MNIYEDGIEADRRSPWRQRQGFAAATLVRLLWPLFSADPGWMPTWKYRVLVVISELIGAGWATTGQRHLGGK